jgi:rare lipoprotein A
VTTRRAALGLALAALPGAAGAVVPGAMRRRPQFGLCSWFGPGFHGRVMANGERFDQESDSAAHRTLAFGTTCRVTNLWTGRATLVVIRDRGPYHWPRILDLSRGSARAIGGELVGVFPVALVPL